MVTVTTLVGFAYLVTGTSLLFLLREPLEHPTKPGSLGFGLAVLGISLWPIGLGVNYFVADLGASMALWNLRLLGASVISVGWFLLAVHLSTGRRPGKRLLYPLAAYVLVGQLIAWTNPIHHLVLTQATTLDGTLLVTDNGPWFWVQAAVNYGLIVGSSALLASEWLRSRGVKRKQAGVLTLAVLPPIVANLVTIFGLVSTPHDLTPFGLIGSGVLLSWALYRVGFLDVVPIARELTMGNMRDAVVTLDENDRVIDANRAAVRLFDPPADYEGITLESFFATLPADVRAHLGDPSHDDTEFSATIEDDRRHFSLSVSPVHEGSETVGRVLVIRDITDIRDREQALEARTAELNLLRQVLTRVLRHNIRNNLVTIQGNARDIQTESEDALARERATAILDAGDALLEISEKARAIERVVDDGDERVTVDLRTVAERVVADHRDRYPDVSFAVDADQSVRVRTVPGFETAVAGLVENAAEHNDAADPHVEVRVERTDAGSRLSVHDDGPGIPPDEVAVLEELEETPLEHASGVGLWLVKWTADAAGATLEFDADEDGTVASMTFPDVRG